MSDLAHAEVPCLVTADYLRTLWEDRKARYTERDRVGRRVRDVLANNYQQGWRDVVAAGDEPVIANLIRAASRAKTIKAGHFPRITAEEISARRRTSGAAVKRANDHQEQLAADLKVTKFRQTHYQGMHWFVNHDALVFQVLPSAYYGRPLIRARDPLTTYPGTVWPHKPDVFDALFAERIPAFQAIRMYPQVASMLADDEGRENNREVVLGEYVDETGVVVALLEPVVQIVDWLPSVIPGMPTVFIGRSFSDDGGFHGKFDGSVPTLIAAAKLAGLMMAYVQHNTFPETNVYGDLLGSQPTYKVGPGAVNFLTPGSKVEKSINTMSPDAFREADRYERSIRIDAGYTGTESGESVATIATGKGLEELEATADEDTSYIQAVDQDVLTEMLQVYTEMARSMRSVGHENYQPKGQLLIAVRHLSGDDPATLIGQLQKVDAGLVAKATVMERMDEIIDAEVEQRLIDAEALRSAIVKGIEQQLAMPAGAPGAMDPLEAAKLIRWRNSGMALEDAVEKLAQQRQAAQAQATAPGGGAGGAPSLQQLLQQLSAGPKPLTLGEARTSERLMSEPAMAGTAAQVAGAGRVQQALGAGAPSMPGAAGGAVPPV